MAKTHGPQAALQTWSSQIERRRRESGSATISVKVCVRHSEDEGQVGALDFNLTSATGLVLDVSAAITALVILNLIGCDLLPKGAVFRSKARIKFGKSRMVATSSKKIAYVSLQYPLILLLFSLLHPF